MDHLQKGTLQLKQLIHDNARAFGLRSAQKDVMSKSEQNAMQLAKVDWQNNGSREPIIAIFE